MDEVVLDKAIMTVNYQIFVQDTESVNTSVVGYISLSSVKKMLGDSMAFLY